MASPENPEPVTTPTGDVASDGPAQGDVAAQLAAARQEATANHDRYLRAVADLENFRRRTVREKDELRQFAAARVLEDLLPVLDNLALALTAAKQSAEPAADQAIATPTAPSCRSSCHPSE